MKLNGIFGKGTGKVGSSVFAISGGEQIVREYNPSVTNPNTAGQIAQRAKLKLMSQLAADLASINAFKKEGLVSPRNKFISANIGLATYEAGVASVPLQLLDLTGGANVGRLMSFSRNSDTQLTITVDSNVPASIKAVVVGVVSAAEEDRAQVVTRVVMTRGDDGLFASVNVEVPGNELYIFSYGVAGISDSAVVRYGSYEIGANNTYGVLSVEDVVNLTGATYTQTRGYFSPLP